MVPSDTIELHGFIEIELYGIPEITGTELYIISWANVTQ